MTSLCFYKKKKKHHIITFTAVIPNQGSNGKSIKNITYDDINLLIMLNQDNETDFIVWWALSVSPLINTLLLLPVRSDLLETAAAACLDWFSFPLVPVCLLGDGVVCYVETLGPVGGFLIPKPWWKGHLSVTSKSSYILRLIYHLYSYTLVKFNLSPNLKQAVFVA